MGNDLSIPLEQVSKDQVIDKVKSLGENFHEYADAIDENGVDGDLLASMNEDDFEETLDDLGVTSRLHRRKLLQEFRKAFEDGSESNSFSHSVALPANGPIDEVHIKEIEIRPHDFPLPEEIDGVRASHELPTYQQGLATEEEMGHLAENFFQAIDSQDGGHRPPIPADDLERVAQVQAYGLEEIEPDGEAAKTLTGYVEMATKLFQFDFGDITFFDHESQFSFARHGLTDDIKKAIMGPVYRPVNYEADSTSAFLCKTDRSIGICNYPSLSKRTFVVHDIWEDETFKWMKKVWPFRAYVGTPLVSPSGLVLGTLCLHNIEPRLDFGRAHEVQFEQVGKMVVQAIENWALSRRIAKLEVERQLAHANSNKKDPPKETAVFVKTAVDGTFALSHTAPNEFREGLTLYFKILRQLCTEHCGYEVECDTKNASMIVAFHDAVDAFAYSLDLQKQLYEAPWSEKLSACKEAADDKNAFRGLRVKAAVYLGPAPVIINGPQDYEGPALDMVRTLTSIGHGGQILTTFTCWNAASFLAETKLESPQVIDLGTHVVQKGSKRAQGVVSKRIIQLVPAPLAVDYNSESGGVNKEGREFPALKSLKKLSKSFFDAPRGGEVTIAFVGTSEIENRYKESASIIAEIIGHASSLLPATEGYQCQNNMFSFPNITEAVKFGVRFMELMREQKPLEDGTPIARVVTYGCVHGPFVALEPHKTTGRADYFGKVVNRAARVAYSGNPGKVCLGATSTKDTSSHKVNDPTIQTKFVGMKQLKGVEEKMAIYECKRKRTIRKAMSKWFGFNENQ